jgi:hypothetical protein
MFTSDSPLEQLTPNRPSLNALPPNNPGLRSVIVSLLWRLFLFDAVPLGLRLSLPIPSQCLFVGLK